MKKLTKEAAREFLKDKYINVADSDTADVLENKAAKIGIGMFSLWWGSSYREYVTFYDGEFHYHSDGVNQKGKTELPLSELLSIEITEEPFFVPNGGCEAGSKYNEKSTDYKAKFEEAVAFLDDLLSEFSKVQIGYLASLDEEKYNDFKAFIAANRGV